MPDRDTLLAFYDIPAEHRKHLRSTNAFESSFATVRHRTVRTKLVVTNDREAEGGQAAQRRIKDPAAVIRGVRFQDGIESSKDGQTRPPNRLVTQNPTWLPNRQQPTIRDLNATPVALAFQVRLKYLDCARVAPDVFFGFVHRFSNWQE
jgi:hypothetical protein